MKPATVSLRDYFAAKAMQALIQINPQGGLGRMSQRDICITAYGYAAAMLENKEEVEAKE